jgi:alpha-beta hydrolase superfamily lysophospholipase
MDISRYARFLPARYRAESTPEPRSTWWTWRGREVHILRRVDPDAPIRVLGIHGAGGYSGALWPFVDLMGGVDEPGPAAEVLFPDLPLYGDTVEPHPRGVRYHDWIDLLCDLVVAETEHDPRPLVVVGASMGGMMAYEVAARTGRVALVAATCLLDFDDPRARTAILRVKPLGPIAPTLLRALAPVLGGPRIPIRWIADIANMSANPELARQCAADPKGGGTSVPLRFLASCYSFRHTPPEEFDAAPIVLAHPAADRWTPPEHSIRFLRRVKGPTELVLLDNCGHFPIEEPGLTQLIETARAKLAVLTAN